MGTTIYTYRVGVLEPGTRDLTGFDVEAKDGSIGKIDEATYDTSSSYVVVDTGFWIFGKKRLVPAGVIERIDPQEEKVFVRMTKDEIKSAPDYDAEVHGKDQDQYRERNGSYYSSWS